MNEQPTNSPDDTHPADILDQALASLQEESVPAGPSPELIATTHKTLWYPFGSFEVQEICRHMTPEETRQLTAYATRAGLIGGIVPSLFLYPLFFGLAFYTPLYPPTPLSILILFAIAVPLGLAIGWFGFAGMRRKQIQMLCDTGYARQRGISPQKLRLYEFPIGRGALLLLIAMVLLSASLLTGLVFMGSRLPGMAASVPDSPAQNILKQVASVYANCKSYQDSGVVKVRSTTFEQVLPFTTAFVRNDRFRYEFRHKAGRHADYRFIIWSDGKGVQSWWDLKPGIQKPESLALALGGAGGVSGGSSRTIPEFLLPRELTSNLAATITHPKLDGDEQLNGVECIRLSGWYADDPISLWIDKQSLLIRRIDLKMRVKGDVAEYTTTYEPSIDQEVPDDKLRLDPPTNTK